MNRLADQTANVTGGAVGIGRACKASNRAKSAVRLLSANDAVTNASEKIRVNSVALADIWTPIVENQVRDMTPDLDAATGGAHLIGNMGKPGDSAAWVVWLAMDEAKFAARAEVVIDAGHTAR